jgi:hypothetical protein
MTTLNSKLVERENLAAERLANDTVARMQQRSEGGVNPEMSHGCMKSIVAKDALLATSQTS